MSQMSLKKLETISQVDNENTGSSTLANDKSRKSVDHTSNQKLIGQKYFEERRSTMMPFTNS